MKKSRVKSVLLGMGVAVAARSVAKFVREIGELSEEASKGYASENVLPVSGQEGFPDTSGIRHPSSNLEILPAMRWSAAVL
ncbi:hypothetical protein GWI34_42080 [Actinomadura sp. DSM 109109]|nr:hypothetical protein [Actinomadura lepetitiana]